MDNAINGKPESGTQGFTLIELLVVIAIIAILASLLLSVLSKATGLAKSTKCKGNLRQVGIALSFYISDSGSYPMPSEKPFATWTRLLNVYLEQSNEPTDGLGGVWKCPGEKVHHEQYQPGSYGYNVNGIEQPNLALGLGGNLPKIENFFSQPTPESEIAVPNDMIAIGDGFLSGFGGSQFTRSEILGRTIQAPMGRKAFPGTQEALGRHVGSLNTLFCDMHGETIKFRKLFLEKTDAGLKRWNKDNESHLPVQD